MKLARHDFGLSARCQKPGCTVLLCDLLDVTDRDIGRTDIGCQGACFTASDIVEIAEYKARVWASIQDASYE